MTEAELLECPEYLEVVRAPGPDEPRLAVARAIRSAWPERAEHIELDIAERVEERRGLGVTAESSALLKRILPLVLKLEKGIRAMAPAFVSEAVVRRGFIEKIELDLADFVAHGAALVERFPLLGVVLLGSPDQVAAAARCPALRQLTTLVVKCPDLGDDGIKTLVSSPHLANLRKLYTDKAGLTMRGYEHVVEATATTLPNLEVFDSDGNQIDHPQERTPSYDGYSGAMVTETYGILPAEGQVLEANYGYQKILHWCTRFGPSMERWPYD